MLENTPRRGNRSAGRRRRDEQKPSFLRTGAAVVALAWTSAGCAQIEPPLKKDPPPLLDQAQPAPEAAGQDARSPVLCALSAEWRRQALAQMDAMRNAATQCSDGTQFAAATAPMRWSHALEAAALAQATHMARTGEMTHKGPRGEGVGARAVEHGYRFERVGENVAMGFFRLDQVMAAWRASPGHCANMVDPRYQEVGMSCLRAPNGPYWAMVAGKAAPVQER